MFVCLHIWATGNPFGDKLLRLLMAQLKYFCFMWCFLSFQLHPRSRKPLGIPAVYSHAFQFCSWKSLHHTYPQISLHLSFPDPLKLSTSLLSATEPLLTVPVTTDFLTTNALSIDATRFFDFLPPLSRC